MRFLAVTCFVVAGVSALQAQTEPGSGAPNEYIRQQFANAYRRGAFPGLASLPPAGTVRRLGSTGLVQEFNDATRSSGRLALVKATSIADPENPNGEVYQIYADLYTYYTSVGVGTAGYPIEDTRNCPAQACTFQRFDRRYALFAWTAGANDPTSITVKDAFYTRWEFFGGIGVLGPATSAETAVTSSLGGNATVQSFAAGAVYNITSGTLTGRTVTVREPVYSLYLARGGHSGSLGYPTGDEQAASNGKRRQVFQGGAIEYDERSGPVVRPPIATVAITPGTTPVRLAPGETLSLQAVVTTADGSAAEDRQVSYVTTNSRVATVQASGATALVRAVGAGTARITATSEGKTSNPVEIAVESVCCAVGEGAPTTAIRQAFLDAVARSRANVRVPGPERVRRAGAGYVQEFQGSAGDSRYLIAMADASGQAWIVTGSVLERYEELGGPASFLGFPRSDGRPGNRQLFEGGALAGDPARVVAGAILARWAASGYEDGSAGLPVGEADQITSFTGSAGHIQQFKGGVIAGTARGAFFVPAEAASRYLADDGPLGSLGFPTAEQIASDGTFRQQFEGGQTEYEAGSDVRVVGRPRTPSVSASPASVLPGGRVRLTLAGFPDGAAIRVSITGQPDFVVQTRNGAFYWDTLVRSNAVTGAVRVRAVDIAGSDAAEGTYTVRALSDARYVLAKASGDTQTGAPGAVLPNALRVVVQDNGGNPVAGATIQFTASPGSSVDPTSAVTDAGGIAETRLRLPNNDGVALVTAEGLRQVVTFSARAAGSTIAGFPRMTATDSQGGPLLASLAAMLRYHQVRGGLPATNGLADVATLSDFLRRLCVTDHSGQTVCDGFITSPRGSPVVNLARVARFVGGAARLAAEPADLSTLRALVAGGSPVLLALDVEAVGTRGAHFVVATGVGSDGAFSIMDPDVGFSRARLSDYLNGFEAEGRTWKARIVAALRVVPDANSERGLAVWTWGESIALASSSGECGLDAVLPVRPLRSSGTGDPGALRQRYCDGAADSYQLELQGLGSMARGWVADLADDGARVEIAGTIETAFRLERRSAALTVSPQTAQLSQRAVSNAAAQGSGIAPGSLVSISGSGLARTGQDTMVTVGGVRAVVVTATPFQLTVQVPMDAAVGASIVRLEAPWGSAEVPIDIRSVAPAIFRRDSGRQAMVVNADGELNSASNPATRGNAMTIYATGLGRVMGSGDVMPVHVPVTALIGTTELTPSFAGLAPGLVGVYQVNVVIPLTMAPGLGLRLVLRQAGVSAEPVEISVF